MLPVLWLVVLVAVILIIVTRMFRLHRVTGYDYQKALKYAQGRYVGTLNPGQYWMLSTFTTVVPIDIRPEFITLQGQDVLSADGVTLNAKPGGGVSGGRSKLGRQQECKFSRQLISHPADGLARNCWHGKNRGALLGNRVTISTRLMELASGRALRTWTEAHLGGPERHHVPRRDEKGIRASGQSSEEGQAALERARGETAALRSLANAGRAMDDNPNLVQLPAWQALADSSGNTLVFGMPNAAAALRQGENRPAPSGGEQEEE